MKAKSLFTSRIDPYRAGSEIAEALAEIDPEIIFIFTSIHYEGSGDLAEAMYDILDNDDLIILGCTGDGFFSREGIGEVGLSALAINSEGKIQWHLAVETGIGENPYDTTIRLMERLGKACEKTPSLYYMLSDFRTDTNGIIQALEKTAQAPVVGGLAGDANIRLKQCFLYAGREVLTDAIVGLAVEGELNFDILIAHKLETAGNPGVVTGSTGTNLKSINDISVMDFIEKELGKPVEMIDNGVITFSVRSDRDSDDMRLRSIVVQDGENGKEVQIFGGIYEGESLQICIARPESLIDEVQQIGASLENLDFKPAAALIVSCAGRKQVLGNKNEPEVDALLNKKNTPDAIAGFPSFGEFGPLKRADGYSRSLFHNMTYILLLLG